MLSEFRVIELSNYPAGSILGMHLADQGADVIKVEPVKVSISEEFETMEKKFVSRQDLEFSVWNRGKKSFALHWRDTSTLLKLISISDIFIENIDTHTNEYKIAQKGINVGLNISYEMAKKVNPEIIYIKFRTTFSTNLPRQRSGFCWPAKKHRKNIKKCKNHLPKWSE